MATGVSDVPQPLTVSLEDGAAMLGVSRSTFYTLIADEKIETIKIGRRRLARVASIERLAETGA